MPLGFRPRQACSYRNMDDSVASKSGSWRTRADLEVRPTWGAARPPRRATVAKNGTYSIRTRRQPGNLDPVTRKGQCAELRISRGIVRRGGRSGGRTTPCAGWCWPATGRGSSRSGFDIREVFAYDRDGMTAFFGRFIDLYESLFHFPKPVVAALSGHTFAGGAILAIACDFRIMAEGDFGFALNEINLGLSLSPTMRRMLVNAVGPVHAREVMLVGEPLTPARALEIGLARELAPAGQVRDRAIACARFLAKKPPAAYGQMKRSLREFGGPRGHARRPRHARPVPRHVVLPGSARRAPGGRRQSLKAGAETHRSRYYPKYAGDLGKPKQTR